MRARTLFDITIVLLWTSAAGSLWDGFGGIVEESVVVTLTDSNFDAYFESGAVFVEFFAPWCGHCKRMESSWQELGRRVEDKAVTIAKCDCTVQKTLKNKFMVQAFPTLLLVRDGAITEFRGPRSLEGFINFLEENDAMNDAGPQTPAELHSWSWRGEIEPVRLMLADLQIEFDNVLYHSQIDWVRARSAFDDNAPPSAQLPMFKQGSTILYGVDPILRHFARTKKLIGDDKKTADKVDRILDSLRVWRGQWESYAHGTFCSSPEIQATIANKGSVSPRQATECEATIYQHGDMTGWSQRYKAGEYYGERFLVGDTVNDDVSSIIVKGGVGCVAVVYGDAQGPGAGWVAAFEPGTYGDQEYFQGGAINDEASAIALYVADTGTGSKEDGCRVAYLQAASEWLGWMDKLLSNAQFSGGRLASTRKPSPADYEAFDLVSIHMGLQPHILDRRHYVQDWFFMLGTRSKLSDYLISPKRPEYATDPSAVLANAREPLHPKNNPFALI